MVVLGGRVVNGVSGMGSPPSFLSPASPGSCWALLELKSRILVLASCCS